MSCDNCECTCPKPGDWDFYQRRNCKSTCEVGGQYSGGGGECYSCHREWCHHPDCTWCHY